MTTAPLSEWLVEKLAHDLCAIPSLSGNEREVVNFVEQLLVGRGFIVRRQPVDKNNGRDNLFVCSPKNSSPSVIFSTHLDTVPPFFEPSYQKDWLFARGASDAKGIAAAMICAFAQLVKVGEHRVGLLFVVGEETNSDGAKKVSDGFAPSANYIINGEPTDLKLVSGMKGVLAFTLTAEGKSGHSAYPDSGKSAIHQLCRDISALLNESWPEDPLFGATTLNIGTIEGGRAANVIADLASASCLLRITTDPDHMLKRITQLIHPDTQLEIQSISPPQTLHTVEGYETCTVSFGSDIPFLKKLGTPMLLGPGSILDAHTSHDRVSINDLRSAVIMYRDLAIKLLQR